MRLKELREDRDIRQKELAEYLHIRQNTYSQYETEQRQLPIDVLVALAKFYQTSTDYLLELFKLSCFLLSHVPNPKTLYTYPFCARYVFIVLYVSSTFVA